MNNKKTSENTNAGLDGDDGHNDPLMCQVYGAMQRMGWLVPQTEFEVRQAEQALMARQANSDEDEPSRPTILKFPSASDTLPPTIDEPGLPASLLDPQAVFDGGDDAPRYRVADVLGAGASGPAVNELARAARSAGRLSPEILRRMATDRRCAERGLGD